MASTEEATPVVKITTASYVYKRGRDDRGVGRRGVSGHEGVAGGVRGRKVELASETEKTSRKRKQGDIDREERRRTSEGVFVCWRIQFLGVSTETRSSAMAGR